MRYSLLCTRRNGKKLGGSRTHWIKSKRTFFHDTCRKELRKNSTSYIRKNEIAPFKFQWLALSSGASDKLSFMIKYQNRFHFMNMHLNNDFFWQTVNIIRFNCKIIKSCHSLQTELLENVNGCWVYKSWAAITCKNLITVKKVHENSVWPTQCFYFSNIVKERYHFWKDLSKCSCWKNHSALSITRINSFLEDA